MLAAHDVTWFSDIDQLVPGQVVAVQTTCATFDFTVTGHQVVTAGAPLDNAAGGAADLVLVTCWPTDALFFTSQRYLVHASLVRSVWRSGPLPAPPASAPVPTVPLPAALAAQNLTATANDAPLGELSMTGAPSAAWQQSPAPLQVEAAALAELFGVLRSAAQGQLGWIAPLWAPGAPSPSLAVLPVVGTTITHYWSTVGVTIDALGTAVHQVTFTTRLAVTGGMRPGLYSLAVGEAVDGGQLLVTSWTMQPY